MALELQEYIWTLPVIERDISIGIRQDLQEIIKRHCREGRSINNDPTTNPIPQS